MMKANKAIQIVLVVSVVLVVCGTSFGEMPRYRIIDIGTLDCYGRVWAINDNGQVAGGYQPGGSMHAVVWDPVNGKIDLGFLVGGGGSRANHINNAGYAVGGAWAGDDNHAFIWDDVNGMVDLGTLYINDLYFSEAFGINDSGQVVGGSYTEEGRRAFLWDSTNGMVSLGSLGDNSGALGINNNGQIVGYTGVADGNTHAFLWDSTNGMVDLGTLGGSDSDAQAINDAGEIVGLSQMVPYAWHAFFWDSTNGMIDLGTLGGNSSGALGINNNGQVVGYSEVADGNTHAFLWDSNNGMVDLNTLVDGQSNFDHLGDATGINNQGQIVGFGGVSGETHAFVMIPVTTFHVDGATGSNSNDGLSRETAFATIQKGIDEANDCDTVLVWPGVYNETLLFLNKGITVKSAADAAVIEALGVYGAQLFTSEGPNTIFENFVITNSDTGIFVLAGSPTLNNLTIADCNLGINAQGGAEPNISNCIFWNNTNGDLFDCTAQYSWVEEEEADPNLVAYWKLDGDATDSAGSNDGTIYGATPTTGQVNDALDFDGSNDYVGIGEMTLSTSWTVTGWFKRFSVGGDDHDTIIGGPGTYYNYINIRGHADNIAVETNTNGDFAIICNGVVNSSLDKWAHYTITRNGNVVSGYKDGVFIDADTLPTGANNTMTQIGAGYSVFPFNGAMDELAIYDRVLSAEEIEQAYNTGLAGHSYGEPLFADANSGDYHLLSERGRYRVTTDEWLLDDVTSPCIDAGDPNNNPADESMPNGGRINMGAYGGTCSASMSEWEIEADFNYDGSVDTNDVKILTDEWLEALAFNSVDEGSALQFDGVDDYVDVSYIPAYQLPTFTVATWVYPTTDLSTNGGAIVARGEDAVSDNWALILRVAKSGSVSEGVSIAYEGNGDQDYYWHTGVFPLVNTWTHTAATRSSDGTLSIYINGSLHSQWYSTPTPTNNCFQNITIGATWFKDSGAPYVTSFFPGLIDEVAIYNRALTAGEIEDIRHCGVIADANLVGYWDFEEGQGQVAADNSGYGNDGTLGGDPNADVSDPVWVESEVPGVKYHVDGASGDNSNDGLTKDSAFATIQKGVSTAKDCDTVVVWPGVYNESVYILEKEITVKSAADAAVIDGGYDDAVVFYSWLDKEAALKNFVIQNGFAGVYVYDGEPLLENLTIVDSYRGIEAETEADPNITGCILADNDYDLYNCTAQYSFIQDEVDEPISYWTFDEDSGNMAHDSVGGNDGTLVNGPVWTSGQVGGALEFDGVDDYVETTVLNIDVITLSAWVKVTGGDELRCIVGNWEGAGYGLAYNLNDQNTFYFDVHVNGAYRLAFSNTTVQQDRWYHVVGTYDGDNGYLYINGDKQTDSISETGLIKNSVSRLTIGANPESYNPPANGFFNGIIDDVRIYDVALSSGEIEDMYNAGLAGHSYGEPGFADANGGDYHLLSERGRYRGTTDEWLLDDVTSPCVDGGDPNNNPADERMPNGGRVNMGAYGGTESASMSEWPIFGDINQDGIVDGKDFAILAGDWLEKAAWKD